MAMHATLLPTCTVKVGAKGLLKMYLGIDVLPSYRLFNLYS